MANAKAKPPAADTGSPPASGITGIRVIAKVAGFRRGGRAWSVEATDVSVAEFTEEQFVQICEEPQLVVTEVDIPAVAI